jgi:hypothetical protein
LPTSAPSVESTFYPTDDPTPAPTISTEAPTRSPTQETAYPTIEVIALS